MTSPCPPHEISGEPIVELRAARIPVIGIFAHHHWFVLRGERSDRWEVWQDAEVGGEYSRGHLHKNLRTPEAGVGAGPSWLVCRWQGKAALHLRLRIEQSPDTYPWCFKYRYWPGPNSNTFAQWVLGREFQLGRCGVGRRYRGWCTGNL